MIPKNEYRITENSKDEEWSSRKHECISDNVLKNEKTLRMKRVKNYTTVN